VIFDEGVAEIQTLISDVTTEFNVAYAAILNLIQQAKNAINSIVCDIGNGLLIAVCALCSPLPGVSCSFCRANNDACCTQSPGCPFDPQGPCSCALWCTFCATVFPTQCSYAHKCS
jgi:hypothetical protein